MKQLTILQLIIELIEMLFKTGNVKVYYNTCGYADYSPMEIEGVEIREPLGERKVTIW